MEDHSSPVAANQRAKKVRIACQRCRDRRIKCDGEVPACSKCRKAGVPCIDVHSRSDERHILRSDPARQNPRVEWLESLVRERLPDIDLASGPVSKPSGALADVNDELSQAGNPTPSKRAANEDDETSIRKRARRMALDLGLLSLDINASQVQYLGSSSGSFFASLLQGRDNSAHNEPVEPIRHSSVAGASDAVAGDQSEAHSSLCELFGVLKELLPPRTQSDALVDHYFSHYHCEYPVLHRPSFESLVDGLYQCASETNTQDFRYNGWPGGVVPFRYNGEMSCVDGKEVINIHVKTAAAQLFFVLGIAAHLHTRRRSFSTDPAKFQTQALNLAHATLSNVSMPSLQVIVLLVLQSFLTQQGGNTWITLHSAMAFAIDLGIHRDIPASPRFSSIAVQMRRRIFFCTYTLDRLISTAQGRPLGFQDDTLDLSLPSLLPIDSETKSARQDQASMPYSMVKFKWATLISKIKYRFYRLRNTLTPAEVMAIQAEIHHELEDWLVEATQGTDTLPVPDRTRLQTKLRIDYHFAICLLYQPSQACVSPNATALQSCFDSASERIRLFGAIHEQSNLYMSWPTIHGIFLAGATLVYSIWMSPEVRSKVTVSALNKDFRLCSNLLTLGSEWWPLAQRGRRSFDRLADSTIDSLLYNKTPAPSSALPASDNDNVPAVEGDLFASMNFQSPSTNIEGILQTFLQNELDLNDTLDMFDATGIGQNAEMWSQDGPFNFDQDFSTMNNGQGF